MSVKRFRIEQLCLSIDSMIFCTLRHYVIVNLTVNENNVQYVHSKTDDPSRVTQYTQFESFLIVSTKTGKKSMSNVIPGRPGMTFEQRERAICMLTAGMSARDVARHFQRHELTISRLLNRFQEPGNVADRPRSNITRKTTPRVDRFLTT